MSDRKLIVGVAISFVTIVALNIASCAVPRPRPFTMSGDAGQCAGNVSPTAPEAACGGRFTADGLACAVCAVDAGCLAADVMVFCVASCADKACGVGKHR